MVVAAYSNRIYKSEADTSFLDNMLIELNDAKISLYSKLAKVNTEDEKINTTFVTERYGLNSYYANMVIRAAKGVFSCNKELRETNIDVAEENIEKKTEQIEKHLETLKSLKELKVKCIEFTKHGLMSQCFSKPYKFCRTIKGIEVLNVLNNSKWSLYDFECYIDTRIRRTKHSLYALKNKLYKLKQKLQRLLERDYVSCFGSKRFFINQYTVYPDDHETWKSKWLRKRHSNFAISGCAKKWHGGNQCVEYDFKNKKLLIKEYVSMKRLPDCRTDFISIGIPCEFVYNLELYTQAYVNRDKIAYRIMDKGSYYIIMATFDVKGFDGYENYSTADGVVGIDINVDNFSLCSIDRQGNYLSSKVIKFDLRDKNSEQAQKIIESAVCKVQKFCDKHHKPLVREDIKKIKFKATSDAKTNRTLTQFAYNKMIAAIDRKFLKTGIDVIKVNPKYTSLQGKLKYMRRYGLSVHQSASLCIARRGLFSSPEKLYYENLDKYSHFGTISQITNAFKKLKFNDFYTIDKDSFVVKPQDYEKAGSYIKAVKAALSA